MTMSSRERLQAALEHRPANRLCVDFGAGGQTGIGCCAVHRLREAVLGKSSHKVKVSEPYQMLGEIDEELRTALELDVVGVHSAKRIGNVIRCKVGSGRYHFVISPQFLVNELAPSGFQSEP